MRRNRRLSGRGIEGMYQGVIAMHLVQRRFPGLSLLVSLNADRLFSLGAIVLGLLGAALVVQLTFG